MTIKLGTKVRDRVTGFTGIVDNKAVFLYGCTRVCIQPPVKEDGTIPESYMIDEPQLEVLDPTPVMEVPEEPMAIVKMGNLVVDPISNIKATVTGRAVYLNGCSRVLLEPTEKHKDVDNYWVDEHQVVDTGKTLLKNNNIKPEDTRKTGGPSRANSKY